METRRIGSLEVSVVGLGCNNFGWRLDAEATAAVVHAARESGVTFFDTADVYGGTRSEEFLGRALAGHREEAVIATKFGSALDTTRRGARPEYVHQACAASLRRLGTDYIDLYQQHWPDPEVPIEDTLGALHELQQAGKVRQVGCCNFSAAQLREADAAARRPERAPFISGQNEYSLLHRDAEEEVLPECRRQGLAFIPYFPLASGLLTGKYRKGRPLPRGTRLSGRPEVRDDPRLETVERLIAFADSRGHTLLELAISWLASQPALASVIAGATSSEQVRANAAAAGWRLTAEELAMVDDITRGLARAA